MIYFGSNPAEVIPAPLKANLHSVGLFRSKEQEQDKKSKRKEQDQMQEQDQKPVQE